MSRLSLGMLNDSRRGRRLDVDIHLLPDIQRGLCVFDAVDHLQHSGIHSFGVVAGQRLLGNHVRLKADEFQRLFLSAVTAR